VSLVGCGGGDGGGTPTNPVLFTKTANITTSGGEIADTSRGIKLIVPPSTLQNTTQVTLQVLEKQRVGAAPQGFTANPNGINVALDPSVMAAGSAIKVEIPTALPYDQFGSMMFATDDNGNYVPLDVTYDGTRKVLIGAAPKERLQAISASRGRASPFLFGVFSSVIARVASAASGEFYVYKNGGWQSARGQTMPAGKRVAVLVHGIFHTHEDMKDLARFLASARTNASVPLYDEVWAYSYNFGARIEDSGDLFANQLSAAMVGAITVDLYGHSMGGLVARWALEKKGLGSRIQRLITLGTPHTGVPLQLLQLLVWFSPHVGTSSIAEILPGVNDLVDKKVENPLSPSFLKKLNDGDSSYKGTAEDCTLAGDDGTDYWASPLTDPFYSVLAIQHDGIVPVYSALWDGLSRKSQAWANDKPNHSATVYLTHDQLNGDPDAAKQKIMTDAVWKWIGAKVFTAQYTVVDLTPSGFIYAEAHGVADGRQAGIGVPSGVTQHALLWTGTAASAVDLNPSGHSDSTAYAVAGGQQVGAVEPGSPNTHAALWSGTAGSFIDLHPGVLGDGTVFAWSEAHATAGGQQVGFGSINDGSIYPSHALLWRGSAASVVDLHPGGFTRSMAFGTSGTQQVGLGENLVDWGVWVDHALLWSGTAASVVNLNPVGFVNSLATGISGAQQVGVGPAALRDMTPCPMPAGGHPALRSRRIVTRQEVADASPTNGAGVESSSHGVGYTFFSIQWKRRLPAMTLTIALTPEEEARLQVAARQKGVAPEECARQLLAEHLPILTNNGAGEDPTLALFAQWEQEDAQKTPEEIADEDRLWQEFEKGINETRSALGMRRL
jgi:pimeloyl-ACP methyl ester carboxylesterase